MHFTVTISCRINQSLTLLFYILYWLILSTFIYLYDLWKKKKKTLTETVTSVTSKPGMCQDQKKKIPSGDVLAINAIVYSIQGETTTALYGIICCVPCNTHVSSMKCNQIKWMSHADRSKELNIFSLEQRTIRGGMTEVLKILKFYIVNPN